MRISVSDEDSTDSSGQSVGDWGAKGESHERRKFGMDVTGCFLGIPAEFTRIERGRETWEEKGNIYSGEDE